MIVIAAALGLLTYYYGLIGYVAFFASFQTKSITRMVFGELMPLSSTFWSWLHDLAYRRLGHFTGDRGSAVERRRRRRAH